MEATDVDEQEPRALRSQPVAIPERFDRRRMGVCRSVDPASEARRQQALGRRTRSDERDHVCFEHGMSVAGNPDLPARSTLFDYLDLWSYDGTLDRIHHALYVECREQGEREASPTAAIIDSQSVKSAEKGGPASIRPALT